MDGGPGAWQDQPVARGAARRLPGEGSRPFPAEMDRAAKRINLWSGPRNVSTALMYSFAQRSDTLVFDEPLYAHFLRVSSAAHPLRKACLRAQDADGERVVREVILGTEGASVLFFKQMAHHLVELDLSFMKHTLNVLLTRDPEQMLPSLQSRIGSPTLRDTGFAKQCEVLAMLEAWGQSPAVVDSRRLLLDPDRTLRALCAHLGLAFEPAMLRWPEGPKDFDGAWASHWYKNVHRSTGFQPYRPKSEPFPPELKPLLETCKPYHATLLERAI